MRQRATKEQRERSDAIFGNIWESVMPQASAFALKYLRESKKSAPSRLLHFTDATGLAGIIGNEVLRLTRARSSNDSMELRYGLSIGRRCLDDLPGRDEWTRIFKEEVGNCWDGKPFFEEVKPIPDPHICCLAVASLRNENSITHWSMYGSGGSGFALVFDGRELAKRDTVDVVRVVYDPSRQRSMMMKTLKKGLEICAHGRITASQYGARSAELMYRILAHAFGSLASMNAAAMKAPEFRIDDEWRLIVSYLPIDPLPEDKRRQMKFSAYASERALKSYYECPITSKDLRAVVVGPGHAEANEPVVKMLLQHKGYAKSTEVRIGRTALRARSG